MKRFSNLLNSSISKSVEVNSPSNYDTDYWGITQIEVVEFSYKWTINNFNFLSHEIGKGIESPQFPAEANDKIKWIIKLYPTGKSEEFRNYMSIFLVLISDSKECIKAQFEFCILDKSGKERNTAKSDIAFRKGTASGYSKYIERDYLINEANGLLSDDRLTIICKMCVNTNDVINLNEIHAIKLQVSKHTLSNDLEPIFENKEFSDVMLNVCGATFHAHKVILAARSPFFSIMFRKNKTDKKLASVDITDIKPEVMREILRYMYTEKVENLYTMAREILPVADKFALSSLKMICEKALSDIFNVTNVIEFLIFADLYKASYLKKQAMIYINLHSKDVIDKPEFKSLEISYPHLAIQTLRTMISKRKI